MPVRNIPKNYRNVTGIAAHRKADGLAMFESTLERDFISLLEFDPAVESFEVQPVKFDWIDNNGKPRKYTPDVLVTYNVNGHQKRILYEVKYRSELTEKWNELKQKFRAAVHYARLQGWRFKIVTEVEIRTPFLQNVKFLIPAMRQVPVESHMDLLCNKIQQLRTTTPKELISAIFEDEWNQAGILSTLWYLIGSNQIGANLESKLTMASTLWSIEE